MKLYTFHQSGSTYRVRIALNLKGIKYEPEYIVVAPNSPDLNNDAYVKLNPQRTAPTFVDGDVVLTQSMAIIEYLEKTHPEPALMPKDAAGRTRVRTLTQGIVCDTHPIISQRIFQSLKNDFAMDENMRNPWNQRWVVRCLGIFETMLAESSSTGLFCHGDTPTMADAVLVPQIFTAGRFGLDLANDYPTITRIVEHCKKLLPFIDAAPENQPDHGAGKH